MATDQPTGNEMDLAENDRLTAELKAEIEQEKVQKATAVEEADKASREFAKAAMEMKNPEVTRFPINDKVPQIPDHGLPSDEWFGSEHYQELEVEPWQAMESWFTPREFVGFLKGCAAKRIARAHTKGVELEDLVKARHELDKAIEILQKYNPE